MQYKKNRSSQRPSDVRQGECGLDPESVSEHGLQTPYPNSFQNLTGTSLSKDTSVIKFSSKSDHSIRRWAKLCKNAPSRNVEKFFKKFLDLDSDVDDSQNLIIFSLCTYTSVVFSWRSVEYFLRKVANWQTNRQTNEGHYITPWLT